MFKRLGGALGFMVLLWMCLPFSAAAQDTTRAVLSFPETTNFPRIETFLDVHEADGRFVSGIKASHVRLTENGQPVEVDFVQESRPGVQFVVAIDPGPAFSVRNSQGDSRYAILAQALSAWGRSRRGTTIDDLSLLITGGSEIVHTPSSAEWVAALPPEAPDSIDQTPNIDILARAVEIASDPTPRAGMSRAVLFIAPLLDANSNAALEILAAQAAQQNIYVFVWMVSAPGMESHAGAQGMIQAAQSTGGLFFAFSGEETLPDPETYLAPLRSIYRLGYRSQISSSGSHQLVAEIQSVEGKIVTQPLNFDLEIRPPNPAFVSPVLEIQRRPPDSAGETPESDPGLRGLFMALMQGQISQPVVEPVDYLPHTHELQVVLDFPDEHPRPLERTVLYVDGQVIDENLAPPFDSFTWDLGRYTTSGPHLLRAEARDMLGLTGSSIEIIVQVNVFEPVQAPWAAVVPHFPALVGLGTVLVAALVFLGLILSGRIRPRPLTGRRFRRTRQPAPTSEESEDQNDLSRMPNWVNRLHWPQRRVAPQALAFLVPVGESEIENALPAPRFIQSGKEKARLQNLRMPAPVEAGEITLGQDPNLATLVLHDASVQGLHARLRRGPGGEFLIYDEQSIAGTWVNYQLVPSEGRPLEHGDLVHIGRLGFRFTVRNPERVRKPVVTPLSPANGSPPEENHP